MSIRRLVSDFLLAGFVRSSSSLVTYDTDGVVFDPYVESAARQLKMEFVETPRWTSFLGDFGFHALVRLCDCFVWSRFRSNPAVTWTHRQTVSSVRGTRWQAESQNFVVTNRHPAQDARKVAELCEGCRTRLQDAWCDSQRAHLRMRSCAELWLPYCQIVVYANQSTYQPR